MVKSNEVGEATKGLLYFHRLVMCAVSGWRSTRAGRYSSSNGPLLLLGIDTMHARQLVHPRDEIMQTMERIYRYRMTTTSGGNLSIRDDSGDVWISPARSATLPRCLRP